MFMILFFILSNKFIYDRTWNVCTFRFTYMLNASNVVTIVLVYYTNSFTCFFVVFFCVGCYVSNYEKFLLFSGTSTWYFVYLFICVKCTKLQWEWHFSETQISVIFEMCPFARFVGAPRGSNRTNSELWALIVVAQQSLLVSF